MLGMRWIIPYDITASKDGVFLLFDESNKLQSASWKEQVPRCVLTVYPQSLSHQWAWFQRRSCRAFSAASRYERRQTRTKHISESSCWTHYSSVSVGVKYFSLADLSALLAALHENKAATSFLGTSSPVWAEDWAQRTLPLPTVIKKKKKKETDV